jgi:uncharacterized small protein (DUF1192 family)
MANTTLAQRIAILKAHRDSGVLIVKSAENQMTFRSLDELDRIIATLEAEQERRSNPRRRYKTFTVNTRSGW